MKQALFRIAPLVLVMPLAACAGGSADYPSLAVRDAERVEGTFEPAPAPEPSPSPPPVQPSPDLLQRLALLRTAAASAHQAFLETAPGTRRAVEAAHGTGVESKSWAAAQVALADLDSARSQTAVPLGDLELMFANAALAFELREPIADTRSDVAAMVAQEDAILAELHGVL